MNQWSPDPAGDSEEDKATRDEFLALREVYHQRKRAEGQKVGRSEHFLTGMGEANGGQEGRNN